MRSRPLICLYAVLILGAYVYGQNSGKTQTAPAARQTHAQPAPQATPRTHGPTRIVTRTRLVSIFSGMENQFFGDVQKKDKAALTQLVTDDFAIWMPNETGDPFPLDDWLESIATDYNLKSFKITHMAAHDFGEVVLVKFEVNQKADVKGKEESGEYFVVDAWLKTGDSWKLSDRYISRFAATPSPKVPVRPTGKD